MPYAAGLYALGAQVYPGLTPELFWQVLRETAVQTPPLQIASSEGYVEMVRALLQAGANPNPAEGRPPLWLAQEKHHTQIVELLKQYGAK